MRTYKSKRERVKRGQARRRADLRRIARLNRGVVCAADRKWLNWKPR